MIEFNFKNILSSVIGDNGFEEQEIRSLEGELVAGRRTLNELRRNGEVGFYDEISNIGMVSEIKDAAEKIFSGGFETLYVFGMGGSSLGAMFLKEAMRGMVGYAPKRGAAEVIFSENIDPFYIKNNLDAIDVKKTIFCFVSKSADTIEVVSQFFIIKEILEKSVSDYRRNLMFITDKNSGFLRKYAEENGIAVLDIAKNVGGRYSIVTAGTLFPAYAMGLDIEKFLHGAVAGRNNMLNKGVFENNPVYTMAAIIYLFYTKKNRNIFIPFVYGDYLREFSRWFRQLFAESLGKDLISPTPVPAAGATDQHSQLQLYMQGPQDKLIGFFCLKDFGSDFIVNSSGFKEFDYLDKKKLSHILINELKGVELALAMNKRPSFRITLDKIDEFSMGELSFMCMEAVAVLGMLMKVNPFDQPGVEKGKKFAYLLMGRKDDSLSKESDELERLNKIPDFPY
jgi:glucose-6-phosphate isomerase